MNNFYDLKCKSCGAHEFDENSVGVFTCKFCGAKIFTQGKSSNYILDLPDNTFEYKKILAFCSQLLLEDVDTPNDVFQLQIISIQKQLKDNCEFYVFNFIYNDKKYFIKCNENTVIEKNIPKNTVSVDYKWNMNFFCIIIYILLAIFLLPIFIILIIVKTLKVIEQHNKEVSTIYNENKKIKLECYNSFITTHNL